MAIALVKKNGAYYEVIDENGYVLFSSWVNDGLHGYTSSTVTFKNGPYLETYNAEGELINKDWA